MRVQIRESRASRESELVSPLPRSVLSPGATFAGCRLEAVAGRGGMGVVYRATQLALWRQVALKAIAPEFAEDDDYRERFEREAHLAASIEHPNVIPIYEAGELGGTLYLIMRWVEGTDMRTLLTDHGRLAPSRAIRLLRPVASALAAAHRRGLVHRDIKPANVLIADSDEGHEEHVYLTDFGVARWKDGRSITRTGTVMGTIDYTAPERIVGGDEDARSDIYSFGCMLFETLIGHVPFERTTEFSKSSAHVNDPVPSAREEIDEVPEQLDAIIAKAMAKDPEQRFRDAGELNTALSQALEKLEVRGRGPRPGKHGKRERNVGAPQGDRVAAVTEPSTAVRKAAAAKTRRAVILRAFPIAVLAVAAAVLLSASSGSAGAGSLVGADRTAEEPVGPVGIQGSGLREGRTIALPGPAESITVGRRNVWSSISGRGELVRVDPITGRRRLFAVTGGSSAIAAGFAALWVAEPAFRSLTQFNGGTGTPVDATTLPGTPTAISLDPTDSSAWVADSSGTISHVAVGGVVSGTPLYSGAPATSITFGEGALWATNGDGLVRVSLGTGGSSTAFPAGPLPVGVALDRGVWIAHANGHLTRFGSRAGDIRVNADIALAPGLNAVAATDPSPFVWAMSTSAKTVYRVADTSDPTVTGAITFSSAPVALAVGADAVWVATQDGKLIQIRF
jgi:hypothetical protein